MPEGHTIHRLARHLRRDLRDHPVRVTSPQGRFAGAAARLDGRPVARVEAWGKHLMATWEGGADVLHVHLGLIGTFRRHAGIETPRSTVRLRLSVPEASWWLVGPTVCELVAPDAAAGIVRRLGPDPLRADGHGAEFAERLARRRVPVAAALLDQGVIAGIGNVYRAELLFLAGIDPRRRADGLDPAEADLLWELARSLLAVGVRVGRIVTRDPAEVGVAAGRVRSEDRLYVYGRTGLPCRRCGTPILETPVANRRCWWCPTCQPR